MVSFSPWAEPLFFLLPVWNCVPFLIYPERTNPEEGPFKQIMDINNFFMSKAPP